jgi:hypothetical protein
MIKPVVPVARMACRIAAVVKLWAPAWGGNQFAKGNGRVVSLVVDFPIART